ncbi:MAG: hypothetical protein COA52_01220 [Hyphomicrobiales bacterium]|nr:MAG: hypothetical protein COA52_00130 [Hyphomicrobiales bacterium]PCJ96856.1 MAG: hypothetical protein COA52_01220 [Hyphomicrobiales bacterium]
MAKLRNISNFDYPLLMADGRLKGIDDYHIFGRNTQTPTSFEHICENGIYRTPQISGATKLRVKAGNAADTVAGVGARSIRLRGIDIAGDEIDEIIDTAGTSASANTVNTFLRLHDVDVYASGSYENSHAGTIIIEDAAGSEDWAEIDIDDLAFAKAHIGSFVIPKGKRGFIDYILMTTDTDKTADFIFYFNADITQTAPPYKAHEVIQLYDGVEHYTEFRPKAPSGPFPPMSEITAYSRGSTGTTKTSVEIEITLIDE